MSIVAVERLRRIVAAVEIGAQISTDDVDWFVTGCRRYLSQAPALDLDHCLGLAAVGGRRHWTTTEKQHQRDEALRAIYRDHFSDLNVTAAARELDQLFRRHRACASASDERARKVVELAKYRLPKPRRLQDILGTEGLDVGDDRG